jgi:ankyrin repeat protein
LKLIPKKLLTKKNILLEDNSGWTPLHSAAFNGFLNQIPNALLTNENLTFKDKYNRTPLELAANDSHLNQIPYSILKQNFELIKTRENIESIMAEAKLQYTKEIKRKLKNKKDIKY